MRRLTVTSLPWAQRREGWHQQTEDARDEAAVDYARVIHSAPFRRLQDKTQILNPGDSDFCRTRLARSVEVAQIAGGIAGQFQKGFSEQAQQAAHLAWIHGMYGDGPAAIRGTRNLVNVKRRWDPEGMLNHAQSLPAR
jgi:dGTP triphosphohydrolase